MGRMSLSMNLHASVPWQSELDTFGRFIGSWVVDWSRPGDSHAPLGVQGDIHLVSLDEKPLLGWRRFHFGEQGGNEFRLVFDGRTAR
jgi:hypothetical protein